MKFKSNVKVTQEAPVNFEDLMQDMDNVLNMELEEAVEHLEDLTILEQNISKYGVTEPVMHLVGGTLESWSIDISNKEACLEGIGDKLKEAGKKVWEIIVKIFERIIEFLTGDKFKSLGRRCDAIKQKYAPSLSKKVVKECVMSGIIPKAMITKIEAYVKSPREKSDLVNGDYLDLKLKDDVIESISKDADDGKGYQTLEAMLEGAKSLVAIGDTTARKAKDWLGAARRREWGEGKAANEFRAFAAMMNQLVQIISRSIVNMLKLIESEVKIPEGAERVKAENV